MIQVGKGESDASVEVAEIFLLPLSNHLDDVYC